MDFQLPFYFIFLLLSTRLQSAAESQNVICGEELCGNVTIPSPFGINTNCYSKSWFKVTCTDNKPFINVNGINLELLGSPYFESILIKNPVTYVNCDHKDGAVGVDLTGTPFYFPGKLNNFGSVGCGNLATIFSNGADSIGGCNQPTCGGVGSRSGCFIEISERFTVSSYIVNMTAMDGSERSSCSSAFMFSNNFFHVDYPLPIGIDIDTTHVPAVLQWNSTYCGEGGCGIPEPGPINFYKQESCGNVSFHYPFGINDVKDYSNDWFQVICNKTSNGKTIPFLNINGLVNLQILDFSFLHGTVVVNHPITYFNCRENKNNGMSLNLRGTRFYYSDWDNVFWSTGCGSLANVYDNNETGNIIGGCLQPSCRVSNVTSFASGCPVNIPQGLTSFFANISGKTCGFASMVESDFFYDLIFPPKDFDISKWTHVPTTLQWATPIYGLCHLNQGFNTTCSSIGVYGGYCWSRLSSSHLCVCTKDSGTSYSTACEGVNCGNYKYCHMLCLNTPTNYCSSKSCPLQYEYNSTGFRCERKITSTTQAQKSWGLTIVTIACSTSFGTIFLLLAIWRMYKVVKRRKAIMLKQKHFKKNGGLLLQQHLFENKGNVEKIKLFSSKDMEKATDYYNENRILGEGGQGTVYKGMLTDGSIVAIKKSKMVEGKKFDERNNVEQFINEVILLSQINHRNVVKLLGCCLDAQLPLLVYEFIPNGTLYHLIHYQSEEFPLTWEMRLRIAIEIADALFYLHSAASIPIYHRDIKSSNILLDDKYRAKVSDFGTSRSIALEQTHLTTRVQGTFGYMDPEYFRSSQFTEKSDVYSFGVVLVELLTGRKPICSKQTEEVRSLVSCFLLAMQENSLFDILDSIVMNDDDGSRKEIIAVAKLAKRCLNLVGRKRPTMKQVAMELELIKVSEEEGDAVEESDDDDEESEMDEIIESWDHGPSCSTTRSMRTDCVTLPLNASF